MDGNRNRATMVANARGRDTGPELALRRELWRRGLRYRVDWRLPGIPRRRADVAFPGERLLIFVDGCFWHGCELHSRATRSNASFWNDKIERNRERDRDTDRRMREAGWEVLRVWEHEDVEAAADKIQGFVRERRDRSTARQSPGE